MTKKCKKFSRRDLVTGMTAFGVALGTACHGKTTRGQDDNGKSITDQELREVSVPVDGDYEKVDLIKPVIRIGVVQSRIRDVDVSQLSKTRQNNLNHMLELIDRKTYSSFMNFRLLDTPTSGTEKTPSKPLLKFQGRRLRRSRRRLKNISATSFSALMGRMGIGQITCYPSPRSSVPMEQL